MNERIRQLAELADEYTDNKIQMPGEYHPDWHDVRDEKFAELIVKECVAICRDIDGEDNIDARSGRQDCAVEIKEHFGVEE